MRAELKEMRNQLGTTTLYVTHDYLEAMSLGDRIVVLNQGRIQQVGTPKEVYFRPASTLVRVRTWSRAPAAPQLKACMRLKKRACAAP